MNVLYLINDEIEELTNYNVSKQIGLELLEPLFVSKNDNIIDKNVYNEIDMFKDQSGDINNSVFNKINKSYTYFGELFLKNKLLNPKHFYKKNELYNINCDEFLKNIRKHQDCLLQFLNPIKDVHSNLYIYKELNIELESNLIDYIQTFYNIFTICIPYYNIILPPVLLICLYLLGDLIPDQLKDMIKKILNICFMGIMNINIMKINSVTSLFKTILYIGFFLFNIYSSFKASIFTVKILNKMKEQIKIVKHIIDSTSEIYSKNLRMFKHHYNLIDYSIEFSNTGNAMRIYKDLYNSNIITECIKCIGEIDYNNVITRLLKNGCSIPNYIKLNKPTIILHGMTTPLLTNGVKNDISIHDNLLITGPNACGKSTFIKEILLNVVLAQTIGICFSDYMFFTPFNYINSHIYSHDIIGTSSLFQTQISKMDKYITHTESSKQFSLLIVDELFNATNQTDSKKISEKYLKRLSRHTNSISIITTHNELNSDIKGISNYMMVVKKNNGGLKITYKIKEGINTISILNEIIDKVI